MPIFSGNLKKFDFPGKNYPFTATSGQIILFLYKIHHFRTYFLYMISYNNMSRPVHDPLRPPRPLAVILEVATPIPSRLTPLRMSMIDAALWDPNHNVIN